MTIMKKLPIAGWIDRTIVCAVILMALVSWVQYECKGHCRAVVSNILED